MVDKKPSKLDNLFGKGNKNKTIQDKNKTSNTSTVIGTAQKKPNVEFSLDEKNKKVDQSINDNKTIINQSQMQSLSNNYTISNNNDTTLNQRSIVSQSKISKPQLFSQSIIDVTTISNNDINYSNNNNNQDDDIISNFSTLTITSQSNKISNNFEYLMHKRLLTNCYSFDLDFDKSKNRIIGYFIEVNNANLKLEDTNKFIRDLFKNTVITDQLNKHFSKNRIFKGRFLYTMDRDVRELRTIPTKAINFSYSSDKISEFSNTPINLIKKNEIYKGDDKYFYTLCFVPKIDLSNLSQLDYNLTEEDLENINQSFMNPEDILEQQSLLNTLSLNENKGMKNNKIIKKTTKSNFIEQSQQEVIKNNIKQFINVLIRATFKENNLFFEDNYKRGFVLHTKNNISVYNQKNKNQLASAQITFIPGYKLTSEIYDTNLTAIKVVDKFVMIRYITYLQYYDYIRSQKNRNDFRKLCLEQRNGHTLHTNRKVKIEEVIENCDLRLKFFELSNGQKQSLYDYFKEKYGKCNEVKNLCPVQPVLIQYEKIKNRNKEEDKEHFREIVRELYFPSQLVYIRGKMSFDDFNISQKTIQNAEQKFYKTDNFMKELNISQSMLASENSMFKFNISRFDLKSYKRLKCPEIIFKKNVKADKDTLNKGEILFSNYKPYEKDLIEIKPFIILYNFYDNYDKQLIEPLLNNFYEASKALEIKFKPNKEDICFVNHHREIQDCFDHIINNQELLGKYNTYLFVMINNKSKSIYPKFKEVFYHHQDIWKKFDITPISQCLIVEKFDKTLYTGKGKGNLSTYTTILFHILLKLNQTVYKIDYKNYFNNVSWYDNLKNGKLLLGSYCSGTYNSEFDIFSMIADFDFTSSTESSYFYNYQISQNLKLVSETDFYEAIQTLLKDYSDYHDEGTDNMTKSKITKTVLPRYLVLFREQSQNLKKVIEHEIDPALEKIDPNIKVYIVFVNKSSEFRGYSETIQDNTMNKTSPIQSNESCLEIEKSELKGNSRMQNYRNIANPEIGTIVDEKLVINKNKQIKFNLFSTFNDRSASIPAEYTIYCYRTCKDQVEYMEKKDVNKELKKSEYQAYKKNAIEEDSQFIEIIKMLAFCQTFAGKTSFKTLKIPALLHNALRMNSFIINNNLIKIIKELGKLDYNFSV